MAPFIPNIVLLTSFIAKLFDNEILGYILTIVVGILGYYIFPLIWNYFTTKIKHVREKKKRVLIQNYSSSQQASKSQNFTPLIETSGFLENGFVTLVAEDSYIRLIPSADNLNKKLKRLHFGDDQIIGRNLVRQKQNLESLIQTHFSAYIKDVDSFLDAIAEKTAKKFITDLKASKLRYNRGLLGVQAIHDNQCIELYNSDYFTFKFTVNTYNSLIQLAKQHDLQTPLSKYDSYQDVEKLVPFLNSIGVGGFIIMNRGNGDELLFGWRDNRSCESGGYWHFTYDETYTQDDIPKSTNGEVGLIHCLIRALYEEIGIGNKQFNLCINPHQMGVISAGIIHTEGDDNRFEFEVCSFVRVCLSPQFTIDDFIKCYQFAKDAAIETSNLCLVPITGLDEFCAKNVLSPEAEYVAYQLKIRLEQGIIKSDHECYEELIKQKSFLSS